MMHRSFYSFGSVFPHKKRKIVKAFFFNILTSDDDRREGFLRLSWKSESPFNILTLDDDRREGFLRPL